MSPVEKIGVKLHIFMPSGKKIWTVVGKEKEHWLDPDREFCSCEDYFFKKSNINSPCYHLTAVGIAHKRDMVDKVVFSDEEFLGFVCGILETNVG